jgi:hypothetical protein
VLLTIQESENSLKKVFLPLRYSEVMADEDLVDINSGKEKLSLVYKGTCSQTNGQLLAITGKEEGELSIRWPRHFTISKRGLVSGV